MSGSAGGAARCFVAVKPPPFLVRALDALDRPEREGLRWTPADQWHVTLVFLAAADPAALVAALSGASRRPGWSGPEPVIARAGPRPEMLGGRAWVLPVAGLTHLAGAVAAAVGPATAPAPTPAPGPAGTTMPPVGPDRPFRGHLTLARARHPHVLRRLARPEVGASWRVEEVVAYRSELARDGARHHELGRWPLIAR